MTQKIDLSLPPAAPAAYISKYQRESNELLSALYTLVPLSEDELKEVAITCENECGLGEDQAGNVVTPAPQPHHVSLPLRAVYESHMDKISHGESGYNSFNFVVVVDQNWKENGVLLVTLYTQDDPPRIDSFMCPAAEVGLLLQNLWVANMGWEELKESYQIGAGRATGDNHNEVYGS
ncbi:unnamed protein product [Periconia digitata]|uniref:DUF6924 domain-containing protein n=1 Tax=Periconia digitata TaxID=1303443 RepID=A0A9W4UAE3_9PLEO|nr:unnamed protein product [Periconia digitata]